jgi:two-component system cell cycle response regulator DivK
MGRSDGSGAGEQDAIKSCWLRQSPVAADCAEAELHWKDIEEVKNARPTRPHLRTVPWQRLAAHACNSASANNPIRLRTFLGGSGGQAGVAKTIAERPGLILMKIHLPVLHGYDATRQIKTDPNLKATPDHRRELVRDEGRRGEAWAAGCDHYVTNPYGPAQLLRIILGFLGDKL